MKALAVFAGVLMCVAIMFATMGRPTYSDGNGTSLTFGTSGATSWNNNKPATIFEYWAMADAERTERIRIEQEQQTQRVIVAEEEATQRNRDFWQMVPYVLLALTALAAAVGFTVFGVAWSRRPHNTTPRSITVNNYAPLPLRQYAAQLGIDDAEYTTVNGQWFVVDPVTMDRYQPPPQLARLPPPRR